LFYSCIVWLNHSNLKIIEGVFRQACRFVFDLNRFDSVRFLICDELKWLFPKFKQQYEILKLCFLSYHECVPAYFREYLVSVPDNYLMTRNRCYSDEPYSTLAVYGKRSVKYHASHYWNNFILSPPSPDFHLQMSFVQFKSYVLDYLLKCQKVIYLRWLKVMNMYVISHVLKQLYSMCRNFNLKNNLILYAINVSYF
jgi:hypothetical protein